MAPKPALVPRISRELVVAIPTPALGRLASVRLLAPGEGESGVVVDLLFASCGIEPEICGAAEPLEVLPGLVLRMLMRALSPAEHDRALVAFEQIAARGANRGKALRDEFERRRR